MLDVAFDAQTYCIYRERLEAIAGVPANIPEQQVLRFVADGLPAFVIEHLATTEVLAGYARQIAPEGGTLGPKDSFVAFELAFILALAQAVLGDVDAATAWLAAPCSQFGGHKPAEMFHQDNGAAHLTVNLIRQSRGVEQKQA